MLHKENTPLGISKLNCSNKVIRGISAKFIAAAFLVSITAFSAVPRPFLVKAYHPAKKERYNFKQFQRQRIEASCETIKNLVSRSRGETSEGLLVSIKFAENLLGKIKSQVFFEKATPKTIEYFADFVSAIKHIVGRYGLLRNNDIKRDNKLGFSLGEAERKLYEIENSLNKDLKAKNTIYREFKKLCDNQTGKDIFSIVKEELKSQKKREEAQQPKAAQPLRKKEELSLQEKREEAQRLRKEHQLLAEQLLSEKRRVELAEEKREEAQQPKAAQQLKELELHKQQAIKRETEAVQRLRNLAKDILNEYACELGLENLIKQAKAALEVVKGGRFMVTDESRDGVNYVLSEIQNFKDNANKSFDSICYRENCDEFTKDLKNEIQKQHTVLKNLYTNLSIRVNILKQKTAKEDLVKAISSTVDETKSKVDNFKQQPKAAQPLRKKEELSLQEKREEAQRLRKAHQLRAEQLLSKKEELRQQEKREEAQLLREKEELVSKKLKFNQTIINIRDRAYKRLLEIKSRGRTQQPSSEENNIKLLKEDIDNVFNGLDKIKNSLDFNDPNQDIRSFVENINELINNLFKKYVA